MGRKKLYHVDPDRILVAIHSEIEAARDEIRAKLEAAPIDHAKNVAEMDRQWLASDYLKTIPLPEREPYKANPLLLRELESPNDGWVDYSLSKFSSGENLTESQKQSWRKAAIELEATAMVEIQGAKARFIRLTAEGERRAIELLTAAAEPEA